MIENHLDHQYEDILKLKCVETAENEAKEERPESKEEKKEKEENK